MKLQVNSVSIEVTEPEIIVARAVKTYDCYFEFDETWGEYQKKAEFKRDNILIEVLLKDNKCVIPWEVLRSRGFLQIGVFGVCNDKRRPTLWSPKIRISEGANEGDEEKEPTKTLFQQILTELSEIKDGYTPKKGVDYWTDEDQAKIVEDTLEKCGMDETIELIKQADSNADNAVLVANDAKLNSERASGISEQANETALNAQSVANEAKETADNIDEIASSALGLANTAFNYAKEAREKANNASENKVDKTLQPNQLYGTDEDGNPALYPTDSVGTQVKVDGQKVKEFNADEKFDKVGGVIGGNVAIQGDLSVSGTTTTKDTETLQVKDNVIVANSDGVELVDDSGFAIKTSETGAYGIMYDPVGDGVKIGLGFFDEFGKFLFEDGEAQFLATRADSITHGNIPQWDNDKKQFVDSGAKIDECVKFTDIGAGLRKASDGKINVLGATTAQIDLGASSTAPLTVNNVRYAVKKGITDSDEEWTDDDKASARNLFGAVGNTNYATDEVGGVLRGVSAFGFKVDQYGRGAIVKAEKSDIDTATNEYKPIVPKLLYYAVLRALAYNDLTMTAEEKTKACKWLGATKWYQHSMGFVTLIDTSPTAKTPEEMVQALLSPKVINKCYTASYFAQIVEASTRLTFAPTSIRIVYYDSITEYALETAEIDFAGKTDTVTEL